MDIQYEIKKAKNKDKDAFANVINYYTNSMYYIARSRLSNIHDMVLKKAIYLMMK